MTRGYIVLCNGYATEKYSWSYPDEERRAWNNVVYKTLDKAKAAVAEACKEYCRRCCGKCEITEDRPTKKIIRVTEHGEEACTVEYYIYSLDIDEE